MRPSSRMVVLGGRLQANLWTPAALGLLLALWLDAADASTITLNGSTVSQWRDKSGNARHASQGTVAIQPTYTVNGLNGNSVITLTQDQLAIPNLVLTGKGWDAFVVATLASTSDAWGRLLSLRQTGQAHDYGDPASWIALNRYSTFPQIGTYQNNESTPVFGAAFNTPYIFNSILGENFLDFAVNGQVVGRKNSSFSLNTTDGLLIGQSLNVSDENWDGILGEVIFASNLSATNRQRIEGYLAHKWKLTANLPSGHPFRFTPPLA